MVTVDDFIQRHEGEDRKILNFLHELLAGELELEPKVRYKIPFYYHKSWVCYLNPLNNSGIELAFLRGNELSNDQGILTSKGRKQVMGIEFKKLSDIPLSLLKEVIHEALLLDREVPYRKRKTV